jgi:hypothetical protein
MDAAPCRLKKTGPLSIVEGAGGRLCLLILVVGRGDVLPLCLRVACACDGTLLSERMRMSVNSFRMGYFSFLESESRN